MKASERLRELDGAARVADERMPGETLSPHAAILDALLLIADGIAALERAVPAIEQGERAMIELGWTMQDVTAARAAKESLRALTEALNGD